MRWIEQIAKVVQMLEKVLADSRKTEDIPHQQLPEDECHAD